MPLKYQSRRFLKFLIKTLQSSLRMLLYLNKAALKKQSALKEPEPLPVASKDEPVVPTQPKKAAQEVQDMAGNDIPKKYRIRPLMPLMILVILLMGAGSVYLLERLTRIQTHTSAAKLDDIVSLSGNSDQPKIVDKPADLAPVASGAAPQLPAPAQPQPSPSTAPVVETPKPTADHTDTQAPPSQPVPNAPQPQPVQGTEPAPPTHSEAPVKDIKDPSPHETSSKMEDKPSPDKGATDKSETKQDPVPGVSEKPEEGPHAASATSTPDSPQKATEKPFSPQSLQPYMKEDTHPFVRNVNPQFFLEGPNNQDIRVAIVLSGVGINQDLSDEVLSALPEEVTVAVSPYTENVSQSIEDVKMGGNTVLLEMPWEDEDPHVDQGFLTIRTYQLKENLVDILNKMDVFAKQADGFLAEGGARLMRAPIDLSTVLEFIAGKKNFLVAPPDSMMTQLHELAPKYKLNYVSTTITNPELHDFDAIEKLTKRTGFAVIVFSITPKVVNQINQWIKKFEEAKINIVPITKIIPLRKD